MAISSPGIGSNLDVNGIVSQLMTIEQQPLTVLAKKEVSYQSQLTAYGSLKGALSTFQSAVSALNNPSKFTSVTASLGDSTVATASASSIASSGSYSLEVTELARSQKLASAAFTNVTDTVGTGQITIQYYNTTTGTVNSSKAATTITIDGTKNSLAGIRDAINGAGAGVTATIINDGTGNRLVFSSNETGTANSLKITVADDDGNNTDNSGLSQLAYDPAGTKNLSETQSALDAVMKVNGLTVTKSSNTVTDAIQGVTLNLLKTNVGTPTTVTVARDSASITSAVNSFVKAYNDLNKTIADLTAYNAETKEAGLLQGDSTVLRIQRQVRSMLTTSISSIDGGMTNLSAIGVSFQKDGSLAVDSTKLQSAITSNPDGIAGLFAAFGKPSDSLVKYVSATSATVPGAFNLNVTQLATQGKAVGGAADIHGYAVGVGAAGLTINAGTNDALDITVDGEVVSVLLAAGTYTAADLATEVQTKVNAALTGGRAVTVSESSGVLTLSSNTVGESSTIAAVGGNGATGLFGGTANTATGIKISTAINDTFSFDADGTAASITLNAGLYTSASLAAELQSKINGVSTLSSAGISVSVGYSAGAYTITSSRYGSASGVANLAGNAVLSIMGAAPTSTAGLDVAGTLGGAEATGSGQYLTGAAGSASGLKIQVTGGSTGDRGTVNFVQGFAYQLDTLMGSLLGSTGPLANRTEGINRSIDDLNKRREVLSDRLVEIEKRYRAQFTALDQMLSQMTQTSNYLAQQLANLPTSS